VFFFNKILIASFKDWKKMKRLKLYISGNTGIKVLADLQGNKVSSLDFFLYNFILTLVYIQVSVTNDYALQRCTQGLFAIRATTAESFS